MLVSIIIPAFNSEATLARCIEACMNQSHGETEVIVVDDGSDDDTARIAQSFPVHYLHQENAGPAAARNYGVANAKGEIVAFTDADCIPEREWIAALLEGFTEETAAVGGTYTIANEDSLLARIIHEEIAMRHERFAEEVDFLGSFNVALRREPFQNCDGFDENFRVASAEDNDLAYRLQDNGGVLKFTRKARVAHVHPTRLWGYLRTQMGHGFWRMKLYKKHTGRAKKGDQYAGLLDLLGPPLSLLLACAQLSLLAASISGLPFGTGTVALAIQVATGVLLLVYVVGTAVATLRLVVHGGSPSLLPFFVVRILRDLARAVGMVRGVWRFVLLAEETI